MTWPAWATPELYDKLAAMSVELGVLQNNRSDIRNFHKGQSRKVSEVKVNTCQLVKDADNESKPRGSPSQGHC